MRSSYPISLFSAPPRRESGPSGFIVSMVVHGCIFAMLLVSMTHVRVIQRIANRNYMVRLLDVQESLASARYYPQANAMRHAQSAAPHSSSAGGKAGMAKFYPQARISRNFDTPKPAPQTMIQPEVPPDQQVLQQIPLPQAIAWTAAPIAKPKIVPPAPKPPGAIPVKPSLEKPNQELKPAEIALSSMPYVTPAPMPVPGTTSPVKVEAAVPAKEIPQTASKDTSQVTLARVISMSQQKLDQGTAALPVVNEIAESDASGSPMPGQPGGLSPSGSDKTDSRMNGSGAGHGAGDTGNNSDGAAVHEGSYGGASGPGFTVDTGTGAESGTGTAPAEHIVLPKSGQFEMVAVGASPEEDYPETASLWAGRIVYSVYLQTETNHNWIMQYSLPRQAGDDPGSGHPTAPWPYDMMRPNLKYKDIVLVHGFVNTEGRFEQLSVAYPPQFSQADFLLRALKKWVFRPAMNEGQPAMVEVLLIIPSTLEDD